MSVFQRAVNDEFTLDARKKLVTKYEGYVTKSSEEDKQEAIDDKDYTIAQWDKTKHKYEVAIPFLTSAVEHLQALVDLSKAPLQGGRASPSPKRKAPKSKSKSKRSPVRRASPKRA